MKHYADWYLPSLTLKAVLIKRLKPPYTVPSCGSCEASRDLSQSDRRLHRFPPRHHLVRHCCRRRRRAGSPGVGTDADSRPSPSVYRESWDRERAHRGWRRELSGYTPPDADVCITFRALIWFIERFIFLVLSINTYQLRLCYTFGIFILLSVIMQSIIKGMWHLIWTEKVMW